MQQEPGRNQHAKAASGQHRKRELPRLCFVGARARRRERTRRLPPHSPAACRRLATLHACADAFAVLPPTQVWALLRHSICRQLQRVRLTIDADGAAATPRLKLQSSICMRKLMRKEHEDVVRTLRQPVAVTHVCLGEIGHDAAAVATAMANRILHARIPVDVYTAASDKLTAINPKFDRDVRPALDLDEDGVQRGTLLFTYDKADAVIPDAATPVSVVDPTGTTVNGRAVLLSGDEGDDTDSDVLVGASGFLSSWAVDGDVDAFPDLFPFGRGGRNEARAVHMSPRRVASLMLRCWDRRAAQNQVWILMEYDADVRREATGTAIGVAKRKAGDRPENATALTVSRAELHSAAKHHDAKLAAVKRGDRVPARPPGLSSDAEHMLRSVRRSTSSMPGTVEFALNKRNEFWALAVHFGLFAVWNTFSPNDAKTAAIADISATPEKHDGLPATILAINAADPGACAMYYSETVNVFVRHIVGWDVSKQAPVEGGGVFGTVSCFAGMTEAQKRLSMHLHSLLGLAGLPATSAGLLRYLAIPTNVAQLLSLVRVAQTQDHPCHTHEFTDVGELGHVCFAPGASAEPTPPPQHATVLPLPPGYLKITKPTKLDHPKIVQCQQCKECQTAQSLVRTWALANCGDDARTSYLAGNTRLAGFPLDMDLLLGEPKALTDVDYPVWCADNAVERAKLVLIGIDLLEHVPGHLHGCFKTKTADSKSATRPTCRFALPALSCADGAVLLNGKELCSCTAACVDPTHLKISADFDIADMLTMELRVERRPGFEYTNNHNIIQLAVFRHNLDTTFVFGRPGMVYYMCVCPPRLPVRTRRSAPRAAAPASPHVCPACHTHHLQNVLRHQSAGEGRQRRCHHDGLRPRRRARGAAQLDDACATLELAHCRFRARFHPGG